VRIGWDFGDGRRYDTETDVLSETLSYVDPGRYRVVLTGTQNGLVSAPISTTIEVLPGLAADYLSVNPVCAEPGDSVSLQGVAADNQLLAEGWDEAQGPLPMRLITVTLPWAAAPIPVQPRLPDFSFSAEAVIPASTARGAYVLEVSNRMSETVTVGCPAASNRIPLADAGRRYTGTVGIPVVFDGGRSSDPEGAPLTYRWQFGDGETGSGVRPQHTYRAPGHYLAKLVVYDGQSSSLLEIGTRSFAVVTVVEGTVPACPGAPPIRLAVGGQGVVTTRPLSLRLRQAPGVDKPVVARLLYGMRFRVLGGPVCNGRFQWWSVDVGEGRTGWLAEGSSREYFVEPINE
jgi:PKD repeat protein